MDTFITNRKETIKTLITQIKPSLPVIYFFLLLFYSIIILFGTKYVMIAMVITLQFKLNYQKNHTIKGLAIFVITQLCLQFLAFFATLNLPLCIILNIIVPFIFIFAKSSQFYPLGYFSYLMTFTFLQLTPVNFSGLPYQLAVMIYSLLLFTVAIVLYNHNHAKVEIGFKSEQQGMNLLASLIKQQIHTPNKILDLKPLQLIQQSLYKKAYETRGRKHILSEEGRKHYLFALMFQRAIYCITYLNNLDNELDIETKTFLLDFAHYMECVSSTNFYMPYDLKLKMQGEQLYKKSKQGNNDIFFQVEMILRVFLLIVENITTNESSTNTWKVPYFTRIKEYICHQLHPNSFEIRFALRMSAVLVIGMSYNLKVDATRSYWLALNMFLLLRPMYEESNTRMKNRFFGTAIGCLLTSLLLLIIPNSLAHIFIGSILAASTFVPMPGTILHTSLTTSFAVVMSSIAIDGMLASELRMFYVCIAILIVLVINKFFFPTSMGSQFKYNVQYMFHMHYTYLKLLEESMFHSVEYWRIGNAQIQYQLVYGQIKHFLEHCNKDNLPYSKEYYLSFFHILWNMFLEMEQMLFVMTQGNNVDFHTPILLANINYWNGELRTIYKAIFSSTNNPVKTTISLGYSQQNSPLYQWMKQYNTNFAKLYQFVEYNH